MQATELRASDRYNGERELVKTAHDCCAIDLLRAWRAAAEAGADADMETEVAVDMKKKRSRNRAGGYIKRRVAKKRRAFSEGHGTPDN